MPKSEYGIRSVVFQTPLGWAGVAATGQGISKIILPKKDRRTVEKQLESSEFRVRGSEQSESKAPVLGKAVKLLQKYFSGEPMSFNLPLDLRSFTRFQLAVWKAVADIPYGETRPYAWIAGRIRKPLASRAVGQAVGANPVPIIIP